MLLKGSSGLGMSRLAAKKRFDYSLKVLTGVTFNAVWTDSTLQVEFVQMIQYAYAESLCMAVYRSAYGYVENKIKGEFYGHTP